MDVRLIGGSCGAAVLGGATWLAIRESVPAWELALTERVNAVPGAVSRALWPVMQTGAAAAPLVAGGGLAVQRRDPALGAAVAGCGLGAWYAAKAIKRVVQRGRPSAFLPETRVRERDSSGLGYASGHAAVSAALAVALACTDVVPRPWRPVLVATSATVGVARIVAGMHLPIDVVGGWALGGLIGLGAPAVRRQVDRLG